MSIIAIKSDIVLRRDNILREWHREKYILFTNNKMHFFSGEKFQTFTNEYDFAQVKCMYFSSKDDNCLVLSSVQTRNSSKAIAVLRTINNWKLKLKANHTLLCELVTKILPFVSENLTEEEQKFWREEMEKFRLQTIDVNKFHQYFLYSNIGNCLESKEIPDKSELQIVSNNISMIYSRLKSKLKSHDFNKNENKQIIEYLKSIKTSIQSFVELYINIFVIPNGKKEEPANMKCEMSDSSSADSEIDEKFEIFSILLNMLQSVFTIELYLNNKTLDENILMNKVMEDSDAFLVSAVEKSVQNYVQQNIENTLIFSNNNNHYIITDVQIFVKDMRNILILHKKYWSDILNEYLYSFELFEILYEYIADSISDFVSQTINSALERINSESVDIKSVAKLVKIYLKFCKIFIESEINDNQKISLQILKCSTLEKYIDYNLEHASNDCTLVAIENITDITNDTIYVNNKFGDYSNAYFSKTMNFYYDNSTADVLNIVINPIMSKFVFLPLMPYHWIQISELFVSLMEHHLLNMENVMYGILSEIRQKYDVGNKMSKNEQIMKNFEVLFVEDPNVHTLYVIIGNFCNCKRMCEQYIDKEMNFLEFYEKCSSNMNSRRNSDLLDNQNLDKIHSKLQCEHTFNYIGNILEEIIRRLSNIFGRYAHLLALQYIWYSDSIHIELEFYMNLWSIIFKNLFHMQSEISTDVFRKLCVETFSYIYSAIELALMKDVNGNSSSSIIQGLRAKFLMKYAVHKMNEASKEMINDVKQTEDYVKCIESIDQWFDDVCKNTESMKAEESVSLSMSS